MTILVIMVNLACREVEYSQSKTQKKGAYVV